MKARARRAFPEDERPSRRKIHVDLQEGVHRKLRVKAALEDVSLQAFVARLVEEAVKDVAVPALTERKRVG